MSLLSREQFVNTLEQLLHGDLGIDSTIEQADGALQIPLREHPSYVEPIKVARHISTIQSLRSDFLLDGTSREFDPSLVKVATVFTQLFQEHATGMIVLRDSDQTIEKRIAISFGQPIANTSSLLDESFGSFLTQRNILSVAEAKNCAQSAAKHGSSLSATLLREGYIDADKLLTLISEHQRLMMVSALCWSPASITFYPNERCSSLEPIADVPFMHLLRKSIWRPGFNDKLTQREQLSPILKARGELTLRGPLKGISHQLNAHENEIIRAAEQKKSPFELSTLWAESAQNDSDALEKSLFLLLHMGIIDLQGPFEPNLDVPGFGKLQTKTKSDIENLEGRHRALKEAIVALENDRPRNAIKLLEPFVQTETPSVDALAYIAVAMIQSNGGRSSRKTHEFATRALRMGDKHPLAHAIMSRVSELENHEAMRARHANLAIELAGDNHPRLQEVYFILDADQRAKRAALNETRDPLPLLLLAATLFAAIFYLSNILGMGENEYFYYVDDPFWWIRRVSLLLIGWIGISALKRESMVDTVLRLFQSTHPIFLLYGLGIGLVVGYFSPVQRVEEIGAIVLGMTLFHVLAEEIFFRGLVFDGIREKVEDIKITIVLSALIFGFYHLTYWNFFFETAFHMKFYWCFLIMIFAGIPYAWLRARSRSIWPPVVCHFVVNGLMMLRSVVDKGLF